MKTTILLAALAAAPALAQTPPTPPQTPQPPRVQVYDMRGAQDGAMRPRGGRWAQISPEGRDIIRDAMRGDREVDRAQVQAARDRIQAIMAADRLDVAALRRAMDEENRLVDAMRDKRRDALLAAVQKLSAADRKAFAQSAQMGRDRMAERVRVYRFRGQGPTPPEPATPTPPAN